MNKRNLAYIYYVLLHKWWVFKAGRVLGVGWLQLVKHDLSKFRKDEFVPYAETFYDADGKSQFKPNERWRHAVHLHKRRNPHHPEWWVQDDGHPWPMPDHLLREMVADWAGAGKAKTGSWELETWFKEHGINKPISPYCLPMVCQLIAKIEMELS